MTSTDRIYASVHRSFSEWCATHQVTTEPSHADVARYLADCGKNRGPTAVPVHLSAIANLFRSNGKALDTKSRDIQSVLEAARRATQHQRQSP